MRQRSCSHRVSELYNEIILTAKFQEKFCNKDSFYFENLYCSVFWGKDFQIKLLILDKETQNIIFENVCDSTYIFFNDLKSDSFLYSFDLSNSTITKFNNPILNKGLVHHSLQEKHSFISLSKSINDVVIKDDVIYFSINLPTIKIEEDKVINLRFLKEKDYLTSIDTFFKDIEIQNCPILIGININSLQEIKRHVFNDRDTPIHISEIDINRKNSILIKAYDNYFMDEISYLIDYSNNIIKQLHPPNLLNIDSNYLLVIPYYGYNSYDDFKLIRLSDLKEIDLFSMLPQKLFENFSHWDFESIWVGYNSHSNIKAGILYIDEYEFFCENLFSINPNKPLEINESINLKSLIPIKGSFFEGYALEIHTIKSTLKEDGNFETLRTELGEMLYQLKYNFDKSVIEKIAIKCADTINNLFTDIDVIIPSPPSNLNRPFQPVYELAKRISELTKISLDINYVSKLPTEQIKSLAESEERNLILERAISIKDDRYRSKNILLFDDLFRSGDTLNIIAHKLKNEGGVNSIKSICVTKTRTKR